jgi:hypothetical protein
MAAIAATMLYNLAVVVQKTQAEQVEAGGIAILAALCSRHSYWESARGRERSSG